MENFMIIFEKFYKNLWKILPKIIENFTKFCGKTLQKLIYFTKMYG